jgi:hypothetical protein
MLNSPFGIETGRWANIPQHERICRFCQVHIGNEFHFLFVCKHPQIAALRHKYVPRYYTVNRPENKMIGMLSYCNVMLYRNFVLFHQKYYESFRCNVNWCQFMV